MSPLRRTLAVTALALLAVALSAPASQARTNNRTKPIVVVHGFDEFRGGVDCRAAFRDFALFLRNHPVRSYPGRFDGVAFYHNDSNCTSNVSRRRRSQSLPLRGEHFGGTGEHRGDGFGHDSDTDVRHIAYHLAWYIHQEYTSRNRPVDIVAWSGGGVIVRYALQQIDRRHSRFPPRLLVEDVVTMGSPHLGSGAAFLCAPVSQQCGQIATDNAFITGLRANPQGRHPNPSNDAGERTDWTVMGSVDDPVVSGESGTGMPRADHRVLYGEGANYDHDDYFKDLGSDPSGGPNDIDVSADHTPNGLDNFQTLTGDQRRRGANWITFALQFGSS